MQYNLRSSLTRLTALWLFFSVCGCATTTGPLASLPISSPEASPYNMAGIQDYNQGNFTAAKAHFEIAIQTDRDLPEAHFNLGLTLHKLDLHDEARTHFRLAGKLAPKSTEIVESSIYRNHMGLSSTLERHLTGGYRY